MPATPTTASDATTVTLPDGRAVLNFGGCNYLGLASHPAVCQAIAEGLRIFGVSSTASRETTGNALPHEALERDLAAFLRTERALLVPDGYLANIAACQGLAALGCRRAVIDAKAHASLTDAAGAAGLKIKRFAHGDAGDLRKILRRGASGPSVVLTDGVFTAAGSVARARELLDAIGPDDRLLIDDCHGLGVIGPGGRGTAAFWGLQDPRVIVTSSLAKGLGSAGGVVAGTTTIVAAAAQATAYVCTTPIAPAMACGTRTALAVLASEPIRVERLAANAERLAAGLCVLGLAGHPDAPHTPISAFTTGSLETMVQIERSLLAQGFRVPLIRYPGGPAEAYFRVSVNAEHSPGQIDALLHALGAELDTVAECERAPVAISNPPS